MTKRLWLLAFIGGAFAISPAQTPSAQSGEWRTYVNPRFGTRAEYPAHIFTVAKRAPDNNDGQAFTTPDGSAELVIYGSFNTAEDTPRSYVDSYIRPEGPLDYERVTDGFFVVSSGRGHVIRYTRCNFLRGNPGTIRCFMIAYPGAEKERWDAIVTRIGNSLR